MDSTPGWKNNAIGRGCASRRRRSAGESVGRLVQLLIALCPSAGLDGDTIWIPSGGLFKPLGHRRLDIRQRKRSKFPRRMETLGRYRIVGPLGHTASILLNS